MSKNMEHQITSEHPLDFFQYYVVEAHFIDLNIIKCLQHKIPFNSKNTHCWSNHVH